MIHRQVKDPLVKKNWHHDKVPFTDKQKETIREEQLAYERYVNEGGGAEWLNYSNDTKKLQK